MVRRNVEENLQQIRNEKNRNWNQASPALKDYYDSNQNKYNKLDGNVLSTPQSTSTSATNINQMNFSASQIHQYMNDRYNMGNGNSYSSNNNNNGNMNGLSSAVLHPALLNIMNEAQGIKFRGQY